MNAEGESMASCGRAGTALQRGDLGIRKIAVKLVVATGTVQRVKAEMVA
jgi:hypothetical protein